MERIGFIGLGAMGKPMARRLLEAGYPLHLLTRTRAKVEDLLSAGALWAESPGAIAAESDVVITMLPDTPDVEQAVAGPEGIFCGARPGTLIIDMSTIAPLTARRLAREAGLRDCEFLDAPVSGGDIGAAAGTLSIMAGGSEAAFQQALPIFRVLGKTILHMGEAGAGQITKAANQIMTAINLEAAAEALAFATRAGVDPVKVRQALLGGIAASRMLEVHGQRMLERNFTPGFRLQLHRKDLDIVLEAGRSFGADLPVTQQVRGMMDEAVQAGQGPLDHSSLILLWEKGEEPRG